MAKRGETTRGEPAHAPRAGMPVVVLHGKDSWLRNLLAEEFTADLRRVHGEIDLLRYDGSSATVADVLDECRSFGLMQQHKLVVVEEADQWVKESARPLVERYAQAPCPMATLVLRGETWNKGKLDALIESGGGAVIKCEPWERSRAVRWVADTTPARHGATITKSTAELLFDRLRGEMARVEAELPKLAAAVAGPGGAAGAITPDVLEALGLRAPSDDPWAIQGPLLGVTPEAALRHLSEVLGTQARDLAVPVSFAMVDLARKLHAAARGAAAGVAPGAIAQKLRLWGPSRDAILELAPRVDPDQALALFRDCVEGDVAMKTGLGEPRRRLERQALGFARLAQGRRGGRGGAPTTR